MSEPRKKFDCAWTESEDETLRKLWSGGYDTPVICERLGRRKNAIYDRAALLGLSPSAIRLDRKPARTFTAADDETIMRMRRDTNPASWSKIAGALGRNITSVSQRYYKLIGHAAAPGETHVVARAVEVPDRQFVEREERAKALERRSLTATFFNDPPPGYSALDRKSAQA